MICKSISTYWGPNTRNRIGQSFQTCIRFRNLIWQNMIKTIQIISLIVDYSLPIQWRLQTTVLVQSNWYIDPIKIEVISWSVCSKRKRFEINRWIILKWFNHRKSFRSFERFHFLGDYSTRNPIFCQRKRTVNLLTKLSARRLPIHNPTHTSDSSSTRRISCYMVPRFDRYSLIFEVFSPDSDQIFADLEVKEVEFGGIDAAG
jgi:hypothetical protein